MNQEKMDIDKFSLIVEKKLAEEFDRSSICNVIVTKNNNLVLSGLSISGTGNPDVRPVVYVEHMYQQYLESEKEDCIDEIIGNVIRSVRESNISELFNTIKKFENFEDIKERIVFKMVTKEHNKSYLKDKAYVTYLGEYALLFMYLFEDSHNKFCNAVINKKQLEVWNVTKKELLELAMKNTPRLLPVVVKPMSEILKCALEEVKSPMNNWLVISNMNGVNGAGVIFYKDVMKNISETHNDKDFWLIPSSIHEVIAIDKGNSEDLRDVTSILLSVNSQYVSQEEILGYSILEYDHEENVVKIAD